MQIKLVKNGIFPVSPGFSGQKPQTGYSFSGTFQGEGKLLGTPSMFIRLSGCNLRCSWKAYDGSYSFCDTPYSSHHIDETEDREIHEIVNTVSKNLNGIRHIIISGGEPMLQAKALTGLCRELKAMNLHITLETNGTIFSHELVPYIDLFSISPKLSNSTPDESKIAAMKKPISEGFISHHQQNRMNIQAIQKFIDACYLPEDYYSDHPEKILKRRSDKDFQLKFVVGRPEDEDEIRNEFLKHLKGFEPEDIFLMPLGETREFLRKTYPLVAEIALRNRWKFTPRLHIELYDNTQWV